MHHNIVKKQKALLSIFGSNISAAFFSFLANIILARSLSTQKYGETVLYIALIALWGSVSELGIGTAYVIEAGKNKTKDLESKANTDFFILSVTTFIISSIYFCISQNALSLLNIAFPASIFSFAVLKYQLAKHQANQNWTQHNLINIATNLSKLLLFAPLIALSTEQKETQIANYLYSASLIISSYIATKTYKNNSIKPPTAEICAFRKRYAQLALSNISIIIAMRVDLIIIDRIVPNQLGNYAAANSLALVFPLITNSLMTLCIAEKSRNQHKRSPLKHRTLFLQIATATVFYFTAIQISETLINLLFGEEFHNTHKIFNILLIAYIGGIIFTPIESELYIHKSSTIWKLKLSQLILLITTGYFLTTEIGITGMAWAVVASRTLAWAYLSIWVKTERRSQK